MSDDRIATAESVARFLTDEYLIGCEQSGMPVDLNFVPKLRALALLAYERGYVEGCSDLAEKHTADTEGRCTFEIYRERNGPSDSIR
jgi:hypothetical protein